MKSRQKGNGHGHVTETPDVSHIKNVDVNHEVSDVDVKGVAIFVVGLTIMTVATYVLMLVMFDVLAKREQEPDAPPMAMSEKERLPPEPRLQSAPGFAEDLEKAVGAKETTHTPEDGVKEAQSKQSPTPPPKDALWEINALRGHWREVLEKGMKDQNGNAILPIEAAKTQLLKRGLPTRTTTATDGFDVTTPTAASSGRVTDRKTQ